MTAPFGAALAGAFDVVAATTLAGAFFATTFAGAFAGEDLATVFAGAFFATAAVLVAVTTFFAGAGAPFFGADVDFDGIRLSS